MIYQCGTIDLFTHVPIPVYQCSAESSYNEARTTGMAVAQFIILNN